MPQSKRTKAAKQIYLADLPVSVLFAYSKVAGIPIENFIDDDRDLWFGHRVN
jgi:hypothetical protein